MKLQKKQLPLFIFLCVVTVGMLGYAVYALMGGGAAKPAVAATPAPSNALAGTATGHGEEAKPALPALPPSFRADPFRPSMAEADPDAAQPKPAPVQPAPAPAPKIAVSVRETPEPEAAEPFPFSGPAAPVVVPASAPRTSSVPVVQPAARLEAPRPARPSLVVTGIVVGENPVAILRWSDSQRQVVQVNDTVAGQYVVDEISPTGIVLVSGKERWRLFLED